ncbi:MAG: ornithine carbamoyltransferase, partial [Nanoarchaeota archaeon]
IRMHDHQAVLKFAKNSSIPVINGLTSEEHPCQILGDFLTIVEKKRKLRGLTLAYVGDANNNVTHSLLLGCAFMGMNIKIACPPSKEFLPHPHIIALAKKIAQKTKAKILFTQYAHEPVRDADIVYTDSWMSYRIQSSEEKHRNKVLKPYQVNPKLMKHAKKNAIFMHCLPAKRGQEVTSSVLDSKQSVVFDQAENRLHIQKAILLKLMK